MDVAAASLGSVTTCNIPGLMPDDTGRGDPIPYASPPPPARRARFVTVAFLFSAGYFFAGIFAAVLDVAYDAPSPYDRGAVVMEHVAEGMMAVLRFPALTFVERCRGGIAGPLSLFALNLLAWGVIPAALLRGVQRRRA